MTLDVPVNQGHVPPGSVACCLVGVTAVADGIAGHSLSNFGALLPRSIRVVCIAVRDPGH